MTRVDRTAVRLGLSTNWRQFTLLVVVNAFVGAMVGLERTAIMKIDLVGPQQRCLAMGLNEFAGYVAVSLSALTTGYIAATYALRSHPFYLGFVFAGAGLFLSLFGAGDAGPRSAGSPPPRQGKIVGQVVSCSPLPSIRSFLFQTLLYPDHDPHFLEEQDPFRHQLGRHGQQSQ